MRDLVRRRTHNADPSLFFEPQSKRVLDDTEKRFAGLFDQLSNKDIADATVISKTLDLVSGEFLPPVTEAAAQEVWFLIFYIRIAALDSRQLDVADKIRVELLTTKFELTGHWIVGVKRLLDILNQLQAMGQL